MFRAAGRRKDEAVCFDQELSDFFDELEADLPKLRELRNALFSHPPFVDTLVGPEEALFFSTAGVHVAPLEGCGVETIFDPFLSHMTVPSLIAKFRSIIERRLAVATRAEEHADASRQTLDDEGRDASDRGGLPVRPDNATGADRTE